MSRTRTQATILLCALALAASDKTLPTYVMISEWGLCPELDANTDPASSSLRGALSSIGAAHIAGIAYGTLGVSPRIGAKAHLSADFDPNTYNRKLFQLAKERNADYSERASTRAFPCRQWRRLMCTRMRIRIRAR